MDEKLRSVLENEELLAKIASVVNGTSAVATTPSVPTTAPVAMAASPLPAVQNSRMGDALALLTALKPFLKQEKQARLDSISKAVSAASVIGSVKNI